MKKSLRVLIIEDSDDDVLLLLRQLRQLSYIPDYEVASTADETRAALFKQPWDIIISDYVLPAFSGLDVLEIVRRANIDTPCIIVSGQIDEETAVAAMKAGARDYIMKDNLKRLGPAIERELQEAENRRNSRVAEEKLQQTEKLLTEKLLEAQEEERKRIARELHDDTAQSLSVIRLELDSLISGGLSIPSEVIRRLQSTRAIVDRATEDVRRYSHELHPALLDNLGLVAALEQLVSEICDRAGFKIQLDIEGKDIKLSENIELGLFRIAQECLNNIWKHASATKASVVLEYFPDRVKLDITDNGKGFNVDQESQVAIKRGSLGLVGMRERARLINADFHMRSRCNRGTRVIVEVNLVPE
jgi:signal transduction histidine kinase